MLKVQNTPNLLGITIHGDYHDLKALYDSLHRYLEFYFSNLPFSSEEDREVFLGLCYDIRHAFQGDRNIESVYNNADNIAQLASNLYDLDSETKSFIKEHRMKHHDGNLYFNVEIFYPWAIYYLYGLREILNEWYDSDWFDQMEFPYSPLEADHDRSILQLFVSLLWKALKDIIGEKTFQCIWNFKEEAEEPGFFPLPESYIYWLCCYYLKATPNKKSRKTALNVLSLLLAGIWHYEINDIFDDPGHAPVTPLGKACRSYKNNLKKLNETASISLMEFREFSKKMVDYYKTHETPEETVFEEELEKQYFGELDWDNLVW